MGRHGPSQVVRPSTRPRKHCHLLPPRAHSSFVKVLTVPLETDTCFQKALPSRCRSPSRPSFVRSLPRPSESPAFVDEGRRLASPSRLAPPRDVPRVRARRSYTAVPSLPPSSVGLHLPSLASGALPLPGHHTTAASAATRAHSSATTALSTTTSL